MDKELIVFENPSLPINIKTMSSSEVSHFRKMHLHREIEVVILSEGELACTLDGERITLKKGQPILINRGVPHALVPLAFPIKFTYIQIDIDKLSDAFISEEERMLRLLLDLRQTERYRLAEDDELDVAANLLIREANEKKTGYDIYMKAAVLSIVGYMMRNGLLSTGKETAGLHKIKNVLLFVEKNHANHLNLQDICAFMGVSKSYFCRLFREVSGMSFTEYLNLVRLRFVVRALYDSDRAISDIAMDAGFSSLQYFNRCFKRYYGCTPRQYRQMLMEGERQKRDKKRARPLANKEDL